MKTTQEPEGEAARPASATPGTRGGGLIAHVCCLVSSLKSRLSFSRTIHTHVKLFLYLTLPYLSRMEHRSKRRAHKHRHRCRTPPMTPDIPRTTLSRINRSAPESVNTETHRRPPVLIATCSSASDPLFIAYLHRGYPSCRPISASANDSIKSPARPWCARKGAAESAAVR